MDIVLYKHVSASDSPCLLVAANDKMDIVCFATTTEKGSCPANVGTNKVERSDHKDTHTTRVW